MHLNAHSKRIYYHSNGTLSKGAVIAIIIIIAVVIVLAVILLILRQKRMQNAGKQMYGMSNIAPPTEIQGFTRPQGYTVPAEQPFEQGGGGRYPAPARQSYLQGGGDRYPTVGNGNGDLGGGQPTGYGQPVGYVQSQAFGGGPGR